MLEALLSSRVRAKLLTAFLVSPGEGRIAWELAQTLKENYSAVWKELVRLEGLGILTAEQRSNSKIYQVNPVCPIIPELRSIVLKTEGVGNAIRKELLKMDTVKLAFIYGSYASGEVDKHSDLDLMIIGDVELPQFASLIAELEKGLNRPINYVIFSEEELKSKNFTDDPFLKNVIQSPKVMLIGEENALRLSR